MSLTGPNQVNSVAGTAAGTYTLGFGSPTSVGDLIVAGIATDSGSGTTVTVADSLGNTYVQIGAYQVQGSMVLSLWYTVAVNGGSGNTVQATPSTAGKYGMCIADYSGPATPTASALDGASIGNGGTMAAANTNSVAVSGPGELVVGFIAQVTSGLTFTATTGTEETHQDAAASKLGVYFLDLTSQSSAQTPAGTFSSGTAVWTALGASFIPASVPPPPSTYQGVDLAHTPQHQAVMAM